MNDAHICTRGKIWDLHIHSNQCYSITDPKLKKLSVAEYVSSILEALSDFKDLDHLQITITFALICIRRSTTRKAAFLFFPESKSTLLLKRAVRQSIWSFISMR